MPMSAAPRLLDLRLIGAIVGVFVAAPFVSADEVYALVSFRKVTLTDDYTSEGAGFGDFNRDGTVDVVCGPHWYEAPGFTSRHEIYPPKAFPKDRGYADSFFAFVGDLNGDGWPDIIRVGFPGSEAIWYENPKGAPGRWTRRVAHPQIGNESPAFADLDGDGRRELVFHADGVLGFAGPDVKDPTKPWRFRAISPKVGWGPFQHGLGVGDVNGDGRLDILMNNGWWEQPPSLAGDPEWKRHAAAFGGGGAQMYAYDVDGDGDNDVVTSLEAHGFGLAWFENRRGKDGAVEFQKHLVMGQKPEESPYGVKFSQLHAMNLIDLNGDGLKDIVTGKCRWAHGPQGDPEPDAPPVLYWFELTRSAAGGAVEWVPHLIDDDSGVGRQVEAGSIGPHGLVDVVVGNKKGAFVFLQERRRVSKEEWEKARPKRGGG
jgi:hypothetical protein